MQRIVLLGANIAHSRSPYLHNTLFRRYDLPYHYELMPLTQEEVLPALDGMKKGEYRGANVTSPYKQVVMEGLDELSDEARAIGAVNTIIFEGGKGIGHNTDVAGLGRALAGAINLDEPFTAALLGTGGAALAAIYLLLGKKGLRSLTLYSRDQQRAVSIANRWNDPRLTGSSLPHFVPADLVIHATPVGLAGSPESLLDAAQLRGTGLLYEMIYSPAETPLMRAAHEAGVRAIGGASMFIGQALKAFQLWTGIEANAEDVPKDLFEEARNLEFKGGS